MRKFFVRFRDANIRRNIEVSGALLKKPFYPVLNVDAAIPEMCHTYFRICDDNGEFWTLKNWQVDVMLDSSDEGNSGTFVYGIYDPPLIPGVVNGIYFLIKVSNDERGVVLAWVNKKEVINPVFF